MVAVARRTVLAAALTAGSGGVLLAGCTAGGSPAPSPSPSAPPPPDPLLAELADENRLLGLYDATITRYPALRARLAAVRADHAAHATALAGLLGPAASAPAGAGTTAAPQPSGATGAPQPSGATGGSEPSGAAGGSEPSGATPAPGASGSSAPVTVPRTAALALAVLRGAERAAASARGTVALTAPADRARLLAGISASESSHLVVLA
ncbi:MAG TPA: hypothetical protein VGP36_20275 [Mycobacteriales bacterium]|nr:hypothetical protein [Mycobacteriales bacterium]